MTGSAFEPNMPDNRPTELGPHMALLRPTAMTRGSPLTGDEFNRSVQHQLQSIGRGFGQGLSRALIEPQSNGIEVGLGEAREIGSSREVLSPSRGYGRMTDSGLSQGFAHPLFSI